ncbi:MAG: 5'-3'-deoxyribonucleotidase [Nanoarchaeota archaeon]
MRILVDMDGVVADFERGFLDSYRNAHPNSPFISLVDRTSFYIKDQYTKELRGLVEGVYNTPGFYRNLPLIEGSVDALREMVLGGHTVYICTTPLFSNPTCLQDKFDWMLEHFGKDLTKKMIITEDKTIIHADILIDDRPELTGVQAPSWEHVLYTQPYNSHVSLKRRLTWKDWKDII